jgi:hypothetical protein
MKRISRSSAKRLARQILLFSMLVSLISTTGCAQRLVVVKGDETMPVKKSDLDNLHTDNENLLKALEDCRSGR